MVGMFRQIIDDIQTIIDNLSWETFKTKITEARQKVDEEGGLLNYSIGWFADEFERRFGVSIPDSIRLLGGTARLWFRTQIPASLETLRATIADEVNPIIETLRDLIGADNESIYSAALRLGGLLVEYLLPDGALGGFLNFFTAKKGLIWALGKVLNILWRPGGFIEGVTTIASVVKDAANAWGDLVKKIDKATEAALPYIGHSPSPLEKGITGASSALVGMIPTIDHMTRAFTRATTASPIPVAAPATSVMATGATTTKNSTLNIGTVVINSGMSWSDFKTKVERAIIAA
jgi:hypothetical protein